ncbi:MAG: PQQ-binding-like beta-propeller repeat protein [Streptosporangiaceae bacterium]
MDVMDVSGPREILTRRRALAGLGVLAGLSAVGCASSSAATTDVTVSRTPPKILWRSKPLVDGEYVLGVVPAGGVVCVGDGFGNVYGLSAASGRTLWRRTFRDNSAGYLPLAASGGRVFAVGSGRVAALSAATGAQLWSVPAAGVQPGFPPQLPTYFVVYANGVVCVLGADGDVAGLDPRTGRTVWHRGPLASGGFGAGAAAGDGVLYVAQTSGGVAGLDVLTGRLRWAASVPSAASTLLVADGVIAGTPTASPSYDAGELTFGLEAGSGRLLWKKNFDTETYSSIAGEGDQVFVHVNLLNGAATDGNAIRALAPRSGRTLWYRAFPGQSIGGTIYAAGGLLYTCFSDGVLRALSPATGADVWQSTALGSVGSITPGSGVIYGNAAGSPDTIYAIRP